jgi:hypothetical protein
VGEVHHGCGIEGLLALEAGSVDLVLSDLPSGETAAPFDSKADLPALWPAIWHALKPDGIAVVMASSFRFAAEVRTSELKAFRYDLIWAKSASSGFYNTGSRPLRSHEFVLVFWREPQMRRGAVPINANRRPVASNLKTNHGVNYGTGTKATKSRAGALPSCGGSHIQ